MTAGFSPLYTARLRERLNGRVVLPGDQEYDAARQVWNAGHDHRPALIAQPLSAADVQAAVGFARDRGLPVCVRGGVLARSRSQGRARWRWPVRSAGRDRRRGGGNRRQRPRSRLRGARGPDRAPVVRPRAGPRWQPAWPARSRSSCLQLLATGACQRERGVQHVAGVEAGSSLDIHRGEGCRRGHGIRSFPLTVAAVIPAVGILRDGTTAVALPAAGPSRTQTVAGSLVERAGIGNGVLTAAGKRRRDIMRGGRAGRSGTGVAGTARRARQRGPS
jgi:hypothetical protein